MTENETPERLWEVHYMSQYCDDGSVPVDERIYLAAKTYDEARARGVPMVRASTRRNWQAWWQEMKEYEKIDVREISLENLVVATDCTNEGRLGFTKTQSLRKVTLSGKDGKDYKLAISLVPRRVTK